MKTLVAKASTLHVTERWDTRFVGAVMTHLRESGMEENPENVRLAMAAIRARDDAARTQARVMRDQAAALEVEARRIEDEAITYPVR